MTWPGTALDAGASTRDVSHARCGQLRATVSQQRLRSGTLTVAVPNRADDKVDPKSAATMRSATAGPKTNSRIQNLRVKVGTLSPIPRTAGIARTAPTTAAPKRNWMVNASRSCRPGAVPQSSLEIQVPGRRATVTRTRTRQRRNSPVAGHGKSSSREPVHDQLDRIAAFDIEIGVVVTLDEDQVRREALERDDERRARPAIADPDFVFFTVSPSDRRKPASSTHPARKPAAIDALAQVRGSRARVDTACSYRDTRGFWQRHTG